MNELVEKWRGRILRRGHRDEPVDDDDQPFGYEVNWTRMLVDNGGLPDALWKSDIAATKLTARILCETLSSARCECSNDPLHCRALSYVMPALKIVQALRKSDLLLYGPGTDESSDWR